MNDLKLRLERTFGAPREAVFEAWTSPEVMRRWWTPGEDWGTPRAEVDLRPGGRILVTMAEPGGHPTHTFTGEYLEVRPPERLVFTCEWQQPDAEDMVSTVTVEFRDEGDETTTVLFAHEGFPTEESRDDHEDGWRRCLENLEAKLFSPRPT